MPKTLLIAGCGYLGSALGTDWSEAGDVVYGLRRDIAALQDLASIGIRPAFGDLLDPRTMIGFPEFDFVVACQALSRKEDSYPETYFEGTQNLIKALQGKEPQKFILISSTSVYGTGEGNWVDEATSPGSSGYPTAELEERAKILLKTEELVLSSGIPSIVFRLGGIYGPGRNRIKPLKEGRVKPSFSEAYTNRIHVADAVRGIGLLLEKGTPGEIYLGVDDKPCTQKEFYGWLCDKLNIEPSKQGASEKDTVSARASNKRCSNKKLKDLGMKLKYPSYEEGYKALLL